MTMGIYKIENLINHKVYIGQSVHIERRWREHCQPMTKSVISDAIKKYGKENFSFQILEECEKEKLNEREKYYIDKYNCIVPKGYNICEYSDTTYTSYTLYDKETFLDIITDIKENKITLIDISKKYGLNIKTIYRINSGEVHRLDNEVYPLRPKLDFSGHYCIDCGKKVTSGAKRCKECADLAQRTVERPSREELKQLIREKSFAEIGRMYDVRDNTIRKWCKKENLPFRTHDIKLISNEDWKEI